MKLSTIILRGQLFLGLFLLLQQAICNPITLQKADSCFAISNYICAIEYYKEVLDNPPHFENKEDELKLLYHYAEAHYLLGDFIAAQRAYELLKKKSIEYKNQYYLGKAHTGIAHSLWRMTDNVKSIEEILHGIRIFEELKDTSNLITSSDILAGIYVSIKKYDDARELYQQMLELAIRTEDSMNIASNYEYLGIVDCFQGNYQDAILNYQKSLAINEKGDNSFKLSITLGNLAEPKMELGQYQEALSLLYRAIKIQEKHQYKSVLIYSYYTIGEIQTLIQSYDSGLFYYEKSLQMMNQTTETREKEKVYRLIAENYAKQGLFKKAYAYHQLHCTEKDSLIAAERSNQLEEIKTRYEVDRTNEKNEDLIRQNSRNEEELSAQKELIQLQYTIGALIIIFLLISLFLAFRLYRVKKSLITANNSKDKLFGIIAHDLKGPIGNIGAMLNLMQIEPNEKIKSQYLNYLEQSIRNLSTLINQLLSWTFTRKGDFDFEVKEVLIKEVINSALAIFSYQISKKEINIVNQVEEHITAMVDENAILTIFRNLISNSIKFSNKGGQLQFIARELNDFIEIRIVDSGVGISQRSIQSLLEGKHIGSTTGTANEKGSGLGISIVTEFVKKLNGKIEIFSEEGKGTTVVLKLRKA